MRKHHKSKHSSQPSAGFNFWFDCVKCNEKFPSQHKVRLHSEASYPQPREIPDELCGEEVHNNTVDSDSGAEVIICE